MPIEVPPELVEETTTPPDLPATVPDPTLVPDPAPISTVDPTPESPPTDPVAPATPSFRDVFSEQGFDTSEFSDDAVLARQIATTLDRARDDQPLIDLGRQFAPHADKFPAFLEWQKQEATTQAAPPADGTPPAPDEPHAFEWDVPVIDERLARACEVDPRTGLYRPIEGLPVLPGTAEKLNETAATRAERADQILTQFPDLVTQVTAPAMAELKSEVAELKAALETTQERAESRAYMHERSAEFLQHDEQGNVVIDSQTGSPVLSTVGKAQHDAESAFRDSGVTDPGKLRQITEMWMTMRRESGHFTAGSNGNGQPTPTGKPTPPPATTGAQKRELFLDRVTKQQHSADRGGTIPDPTAPEGTLPNPDANFGDILGAVVAAGGGFHE